MKDAGPIGNDLADDDIGMGVSPRTLYQYLAGSRRTPDVAINAARFALAMMGIPMAISGDEARRNLGFGNAEGAASRKF
jgi:hypothetical protein